MENNRNDVIDYAYKDYVFAEKRIVDNVKIYRFENETGMGEMKVYNLLDGIQLVYNDLNMETTYQDIKPKKGILQIDHCLEGCYGIDFKNYEYAFLSRGDLSIIDVGETMFENSHIPTKKYKGLSVLIYIDVAQKTIENLFPFLNIDIYKIREILCRKRGFSIINSKHKINNIVNELYEVDERIQIPYLIIKVIELLLFLETVEINEINKITSFSKPVYDATKKCYNDLLENPFDRSYISELAKRYAISESSLKRCFVYIAGNSIGNFKKNIRLEAASKILIDNCDMSIKQVSEIAGYVNQSKFSHAFKSYFGVSPNKYRNNYI